MNLLTIVNHDAEFSHIWAVQSSCSHLPVWIRPNSLLDLCLRLSRSPGAGVTNAQKKKLFLNRMQSDLCLIVSCLINVSYVTVVVSEWAITNGSPKEPLTLSCIIRRSAGELPDIGLDLLSASTDSSWILLKDWMNQYIIYVSRLHSPTWLQMCYWY